MEKISLSLLKIFLEDLTRRHNDTEEHGGRIKHVVLNANFEPCATLCVLCVHRVSVRTSSRCFSTDSCISVRDILKKTVFWRFCHV